MKPITDTQCAILRAAAAHPRGLALPPPHLPPAPRAAVAKALLGAGLLARVAGSEGTDPSLAWKLDGESVLLRLTEAGLHAIGAAPAPTPPEPQEAPSPSRQGRPLRPPRKGTQAAVGPRDAVRRATPATEAAQAAPEGPQRAPGRQALRGAARAVLAAWEGAPAGERVALAAAIEELRRALAKSAMARPASSPGPLRAGTKREAVLALLRRPEGASGPAIAAATGWAPHTVRGFLAALKKCGVAVLVHARVRQVGPGKAGAKGSYSIYRIVEAG